MRTCKKGRSSDCVPTTSPMIKSTKDGEEEAEGSSGWNCLPSRGGSSRFIESGSRISP